MATKDVREPALRDNLHISVRENSSSERLLHFNVYIICIRRITVYFRS